VVKHAQAPRLRTQPNPSALGQPVEIRFTSPASGWTGNVTFRVGTTVLGTSALDTGVATLSVSSLPMGTTTITADYAGNQAATSLTATHVVKQANDPSSITLSASASQMTACDPLTLTATVTGTGLSGDVVFRDGLAEKASTKFGSVEFRVGQTA
jgi:hypothetical protein